MKHYTRFLLSVFALGLFLSLSNTAVYAQETSEKAKQPMEIDIISDKAKESITYLVGGNFSIVGKGKIR